MLSQKPWNTQILEPSKFSSCTIFYKTEKVDKLVMVVLIIDRWYQNFLLVLVINNLSQYTGIYC